MTTEQLFKKLLDLGYEEERVDSGVWSYNSPDCPELNGSFEVYLCVKLENGKLDQSLSVYFNSNNETIQNSRVPESNEESVTPDEIWNFIENFQSKKVIFNEYLVSCKINAPYDITVDQIKNTIFGGYYVKKFNPYDIAIVSV
ncbi:MAG TPA: hypothetical protein VKR58_05890 [Aquella sp.]|nr:hypothetical protein [Aquella sp.]